MILELFALSFFFVAILLSLLGKVILQFAYRPDDSAFDVRIKKGSVWYRKKESFLLPKDSSVSYEVMMGRDGWFNSLFRVPKIKIEFSSTDLSILHSVSYSSSCLGEDIGKIQGIQDFLETSTGDKVIELGEGVAASLELKFSLTASILLYLLSWLEV